MAWVPMSPTLPFFVRWAAARAAGSTTPYRGTAYCWRRVSRAVVETVPQAMTMALGSKVLKKATSCWAYLMMVSLERLP